jgi:soluble lytic murein transglycosylase-like protein
MQPLGELIKLHATRHNLDPELVAAVVLQESAGQATEKRLENGFYRKYVRKTETIGNVPPGPDDVPASVEAVLRSTSFGLMQIMGQVAREFGFKNRWLSDLEDRGINLNLGCQIFSKHLRDRGSVRLALLRWNGGGNAHYDDEVIGRIVDGSAKRLLEV